MSASTKNEPQAPETGPEAVTLNRKTLIDRVKASAKAMLGHDKAGVLLRWNLAQDLFDLRGTFAQGKDEAEAFLATATTASGLDASVVKNLVRAIEVRDGLTPKQIESVTSAGSVWPTDSVLPFAGLDRAQANRLIGKVEKAGTTNTKVVRKAKAEIVGTKQRNRQAGPEATAKMVAEIRDEAEKLLATYPGQGLAIIAGIQFRNAHPTGDLAEAMTFIMANPVPVEVEAEITK